MGYMYFPDEINDKKDKDNIKTVIGLILFFLLCFVVGWLLGMFINKYFINSDRFWDIWESLW